MTPQPADGPADWKATERGVVLTRSRTGTPAPSSPRSQPSSSPAGRRSGDEIALHGLLLAALATSGVQMRRPLFFKSMGGVQWAVCYREQMNCFQGFCWRPVLKAAAREGLRGGVKGGTAGPPGTC